MARQFEDLPENAVDFFRNHVQLYLTDPARAHLWDSTVVGGPGLVPTLLLTTTGRKTGKQRHAPLLYLDHDAGGYLIMGSRGGTEVNPAWVANLRDNPDCEIRVGTLHTRARARILPDDERALLWPRIVAQRPVYGKYQSRTDRIIPVIHLQPTGDPLQP